MAEIKKEKVDFSRSNLRSLDVSRDENIVSLDCRENPLIFIKSNVPAAPASAPAESQGAVAAPPAQQAPPASARGELILRACKGGTVGLQYSPLEGQNYYAYADEGYRFEGWYDVLGDRLSREAVWHDAYGTAREIFAMFVKA